MQRKHLALAALALCSGLASAAGNVALGSNVSLIGAGFGSSPGWGVGVLADPSTVTDGAYLPNGTQWNIGTVFWSGAPWDDVIMITLPTTATVSHIDLQADNNDDYAITYLDVGSVWHDLTTISPNRSWGMDMGSADFAPVTAKAFMIYAAGGDRLYSVSEFQAIGNPVPEPETWALMLAGLAAVGAVARRRSAR